jgi:hypothetical protein
MAMKKIRYLVAHLMAAAVSWVACNAGALAGQPQILVMFSLAIGYLYKLAVQTSNSPSERLEIEFHIPSYVD